jgi:hypothetical protein
MRSIRQKQEQKAAAITRKKIFVALILEGIIFRSKVIARINDRSMWQWARGMERT